MKQFSHPEKCSSCDKDLERSLILSSLQLALLYQVLHDPDKVENEPTYFMEKSWIHDFFSNITFYYNLSSESFI